MSTVKIVDGFIRDDTSLKPADVAVGCDQDHALAPQTVKLNSKICSAYLVGHLPFRSEQELNKGSIL